MIHNYITRPSAFPITGQLPWSVIAQLDDTLRRLMASLGSDYDIHRTAFPSNSMNNKKLFASWTSNKCATTR